MAVLLFRWAERFIYYTFALVSFPEIFRDLIPSLHTGHPFIILPLMLLELMAILTLIHPKLSKVSWIILYALNLTLTYDASIVGKGTKLLFPLIILFGSMFQVSKKEGKVPALFTQGLLLFISLMYFFSGFHKFHHFSVYQFFISGMSSMPWTLANHLKSFDEALSILIVGFECLGVFLYPVSFFSWGKKIITFYKYPAIIFHLVIFFFTPLKFFSLLCIIPWLLIREGENPVKDSDFPMRKIALIFFLISLTLLNNLWFPSRKAFSYLGLDLSWNLVPQTGPKMTSTIVRNNEVLYHSENGDSLFWYYYLTDAYRHPKKLQGLKIKLCQRPEDVISLYYKKGTKTERTWIHSCSDL